MLHKEKLYAIKNLQLHKKNDFIIHRLDAQENIYHFDEIIIEVEKLINKFQQHNIPEGIGIAVHLEEHTPWSCVILLAILNHNCYFHTLDKLIPDHLPELDTSWLITKTLPNQVESKISIEIMGQVHFLTGISKSSKANSKLKLPNNMCYSIATTGSTGQAKIVHVPYECIALNVHALSNRLALNSKDLIYLCAPPTFDPFVVEFFMTMQSGAALLLTSSQTRLSPDKLLRKLFPTESYIRSCSVLQMTPSHFRCFGTETIRDQILNECSSLRVLLLGGEAFPSLYELESWLTPKTFQCKLVCNIYGITEVSCWSTIYVCKDLAHIRQQIPLGEPIETDTKIRIINESGEVINGPGEGSLWLGNSSRRCYIPKVDGEAFNNSDVLYRNTGDIVCRKDGQIYHLGRTNEIIKRAGTRLCLSTLGEKIGKLLGHKVNVHFVWLPKENKLVCVLNLLEDFNNEELCQQKSLIRSQLAPHEQPDKYVYLDFLPLNKHSKIDRHELAEICRKHQSSKEPLTLFEEFLRETLGLNLKYKKEHEVSLKKRLKPNLDVSFCSAGGTSYHALSLATEIGNYMSDAVEQRKLLEYLLDERINIDQIMKFLMKVTLKCLTSSKSELSQASKSDALFKFTPVWRLDLQKCIDAPVAAYNNQYIAVGSHSKLLKVIDALTGLVISTLCLPDRIECKVTWINAELALVGCYDGNLYAFQPLIGDILWSVSTGGMIKAQPLLCSAYDVALIGSYATDYNITCISLKSHNAIWRLRVGTKGIFAAPLLIDDDSVLICCLDGTYVRLELKNGNIGWQQKCATSIFSTPVLLSKTTMFLVAEVSGLVHICDIRNGDYLCSFRADGNIFSSLTQCQQSEKEYSLLFGCHDANLYCLSFVKDSEELKLRWCYKSTGTIFAKPILLKLNNSLHVLCCSTKGSLNLIRLSDGHLVATHDVQGEIFSTPCCIENQRIYVGCRDNFCYSFNVASSNKLNT